MQIDWCAVIVPEDASKIMVVITRLLPKIQAKSGYEYGKRVNR